MSEDQRRTRASVTAVSPWVGALLDVTDSFEQLPLLAAGMHGPKHVLDAANAVYRGFINRQDVLGRQVGEVFPELQGQQLLELFDRVYDSGEPESIREWRFQLPIGDSNQLAEFYIDLTAAPRRSPAGVVFGVAAFGIDVTRQVRERLSAQHRAAEAERRYQAVRDVVAELQGALLPTNLPVLPTAILAARYLVASRDQTAGGDWFDGIPLSDGRLALIVGDIVGHGVAASAAMGQLRSVLRSVLLETADPHQALAWADRAAARTGTMRAATMCVVVVDPGTGALSYGTCGHPPPLLIGPDGATRYLPATGGQPLGTGSRPTFATATLERGEVLLLYSDGLIERPGATLGEGMAALARVAGDAVANRLMPVGASSSAAERVCQQGVELMTRLGYDDDVTALAVQRRDPPIRPLHVEQPATPDAITGLCAAVRAWLAPAEPDRRTEEAVRLAVSELVANTVEHAYPPGNPGLVHLDADLLPDGTLQIRVGDDGVWVPPPRTPRITSGRGLWMVGATVDDITVDHAGNPSSADDRPAGDHPSTGTVVTVRLRLARPAMLGPAPAGMLPGRAVAPFATHVDVDAERVLHVSGPIDIATAHRFADRLDIAGRGGVHPLTVDLTGVDVLTSAGVSVLFHARDRHATHGHPLDLVADHDSLVAQVLDLVGLSHRHPAPSA